MHGSFRRRRAVQLALTANALRPIRGTWSSLVAFFAGWLTAELSPHLLALTAADTARHVLRKERTDWLAVAAAGASMAGLAALMRTSGRARDEVQDALTEALGPDYQDNLPKPPAAGDLATPWRQLVFPFRMRDPLVGRERNIAYAPGGRRYLLDVYRPREEGTDRPVLVQVHGGAWVIGRKDQQGIPLMLHMAAQGWVCVAINYPLSPRVRWPAHIVAAKRALVWVKENIASYGGDPEFVAVTGGSAGAHMSALLALSADDPTYQPGFEEADTSVQACVPHYGVYDWAGITDSKAVKLMQRTVLERVVIKQSVRDAEELYLAASPLSRISRSAPPFFVVHGKHDSLVPVGEAREFVRRLRAESAAPVVYAEISGAQHAFDIFPSIRSAHVVRGVRRFLEWTHARYVEGREVTNEAGPATAPRRR